MPLYTWKDETSGKHVDVIRRFDNHDVPPTREDISDKEMSDAEVEAAKWKKVLNAHGFIRMPGWRGAKGYWIYPIIMIGELCIHMQNYLV